jgi:hypothetical protein
MKSLSVLLLAGILMLRSPVPVNDAESGFPLACTQDFETTASIGGFVFSDPQAWFLTGGMGGGRALEFAGRGDYEPKVRSPYIVGLIDGLVFVDFVLEADVLQTGREYGHRAMCIFFGFQDSTRFYYVHLASRADPNAHNIFLVRDAPGTGIAEVTTDGVRWGEDQWHHIRIERYTGEGTVKVFFDDPDTPIMIAHDRTFNEGYIGIGSFDDSGKIDNIRIWSPDARKSKAPFFAKK